MGAWLISLHTCCLWLLCRRVTLKERVVEENVKRHSFFSVAAQKTEEKILKFRCRSNGKSRETFRYNKQANGAKTTHLGAKFAFFS